MTENEASGKPLKVCIDARLKSGVAGGVEQVVIGLAYGLSQLNGGAEEYHFLAYPDADAWIKPFLSGPCRMLYCPESPRSSKLRMSVRSRWPRLEKLYPFSERWTVRNLFSGGVIEKSGMDIMHFTQQIAFLTTIPSLYHPHDLQHKHYPQYFSLMKCLIRDMLYRTFCRRARLVAVASSWVRSDVLQLYKLPDEKVRVIPFAPPLCAYGKPTPEDMQDVRQKYDLPDAYVFYPAQTWPHKNHLGLIDAVADIRDRLGLIIPVVFSGSIAESFFPVIAKRIRERNLNGQIRFLGFVSPMELQSLYLLSRCVVIPTKYEAGSFPLWEAFLSGVPAACSNVTSLPAQAGDAAITFHPEKPAEISDAVLRLWTDERLRQTLIDRGRRNVALYSWEKTARLFRANYRRIAGRPLSEEDRRLLAAKPTI